MLVKLKCTSSTGVWQLGSHVRNDILSCPEGLGPVAELLGYQDFSSEWPQKIIETNLLWMKSKKKFIIEHLALFKKTCNAAKIKFYCCLKSTQYFSTIKFIHNQQCTRGCRDCVSLHSKQTNCICFQLYKFFCHFFVALFIVLPF